MRDYVSLLVIVLFLFAAGAYMKDTHAESAKQPDPVAKHGSVNVYSARKEELVKPVFQAFTAKTGIDVNYIVADAPKLIARLEQEGEHSPADLFIASDVGNLWQAADRGVLQPITDPALLKAVPDAYRAPDAHWLGLTRRLRLMFVTNVMLEEGGKAPAGMAALAGPEYDDAILVRSSSNIYNQSLLASIIHATDEETAYNWAKGLVHNMARSPQGGDTDQLRALAAGEGTVAIANHYYYARLAMSDNAEEKAIADAITMVLPAAPAKAHVNLSGAGIAKHAPRKDAALELLQYMLSIEGQKLYAALNNELPIIGNVPTTDVVKTLASIPMDIDAIAYLGPLNAKAVEVADKAGWR